MSVSNVTIANRALTLLSVDRILSFTDNSEQARKINAVFNDTRDALLEEHNWNFAMKERAFSLLSDEPILDDWSYAYQIPSDCIRILKMQDYYEFAQQGNKVYSNSTDSRFLYVSRETDPTRFSPGFIKALASRLAADLAFGLTQNATLATSMDTIAIRDLKEAKMSDAQCGVGTRVIRGSMIQGT